MTSLDQTPGEANLSKLYGDGARCPSCGAFAKTLPDPEHRWVCAVCGAPRVVMPEGEALPEESAVALREASHARRASAMQRLVAWGTALPAAFSLLLAIALAPASFIASGVLIGAGLVLAFLSSRASRKGATERKRLRSAVERAYETAIETLHGKNMTPEQIAEGLRIAESDVETALAVSTHVRVAPAMARVAKEPEAELESESDAASDAEAAKK